MGFHPQIADGEVVVHRRGKAHRHQRRVHVGPSTRHCPRTRVVSRARRYLSRAPTSALVREHFEATVQVTEGIRA
jgi:predicted transcriptional regulator